MRFTKKQLVIDYLSTFNTEHGQRVLADLKKRAPLLREQLNTKGGVDTSQLLVEMGRCDVVKHICRMLRTDPNDEREPFAQGE